MCNLNSPKNFTFPSGNLKTEFAIEHDFLYMPLYDHKLFDLVPFLFYWQTGFLLSWNKLVNSYWCWSWFFGIIHCVPCHSPPSSHGSNFFSSGNNNCYLICFWGSGNYFSASSRSCINLRLELRSWKASSWEPIRSRQFYLHIWYVEKTSSLTAAGLAQSVSRVLDCRAGGCGFNSRDWTNTQSLKMTEKWRYCLCPANG